MSLFQFYIERNKSKQLILLLGNVVFRKQIRMALWARLKLRRPSMRKSHRHTKTVGMKMKFFFVLSFFPGAMKTVKSCCVLPWNWISYVIFRYETLRAKCLFQAAHKIKTLRRKRKKKQDETNVFTWLQPKNIISHKCVSRSTNFRFVCLNVYRLEYIRNLVVVIIIATMYEKAEPNRFYPLVSIW